MKKVLILILIFILYIFTSSTNANSRNENARYDSNNLPEWIVEEWSKAQDELLELDNMKQDPRRFGPEEWEWIQFDRPFTDGVLIQNKEGKWVYRIILGVTRVDDGQILICCGDKETIRHEAVHAILWRMGDLERYYMHYPEFLKRIEELKQKQK